MEAFQRKLLGLPIPNLYEYWVHYWSKLISELQDKSNYEVSLDSPRFVIEDIISEIEGQGLVNQENAKSFVVRLSFFDKEDHAFYSSCHSIVKVILATGLEVYSSRIVYDLCKRLIVQLNDGTYYKSLINELEVLLSCDGDITTSKKEKIRFITELVIAEYLSKGYDLQDIKNLPTITPGVAITESGVVLAAPDNYKELHIKEYQNQEEYYKAITVYLKERTVKQKLEILSEYFDRKPEDVIALIRLGGIKGNIDIQIGDICLYSPKIKKYINSEIEISKIEQVDSEYKYVNAAIPIKHLSYYSSIAKAKRKLYRALDFITLALNTSNTISILNNEYVLVKDGEEYGQSTSMVGNDPRYAYKQQYYDYINAFNAESYKDDLEWISNHFAHLQCKDYTRLYNSIHWYYKAKQSERNEDVLLFAWFSLESLLKVDDAEKAFLVQRQKECKGMLHIIQEICCPILAKHVFENKLHNEYYLQMICYKHNNYFDIPVDIAKEAALDLNTGDSYLDSNFLNSLNKLIPTINDETVKDDLQKVLEFYSDIKPIKRYVENVKADLLMIYRLRNMIVHNAMLHSISLEKYAKKAIFISQTILKSFIMQFEKSPSSSIFDLMISTVANGKVFESEYEDNLKKLRNKNK